MSEIIEKIETIKNLFHLKKCTQHDIDIAELKLQLSLSNDYKSYISTYGAISFNDSEWTGLGASIPQYLNVIYTTLIARESHHNFRPDFFVIEEMQIDDVIIVSNAVGKIYIVNNSKEKLLCNSLSEYIDLCLMR